MRKVVLIGLLIVLVFFLGCSFFEKNLKRTKSDVNNYQEYQYLLLEHTGENQYIVKGDKEIHYYFSEDSNNEAVYSFEQLGVNIRHSWTENRIYFIGRFTGNIKTAKELFPERYKLHYNSKGEPIKPITSPDTKYYEFLIENWYIEIPFRVMSFEYGEVKYSERSKLLQKDFKNNIKIDLQKHMKNKIETQ